MLNKLRFAPFVYRHLDGVPPYPYLLVRSAHSRCRHLGKEAEGIAYSNIFKTVKQAVTTRQVAEHLGLVIDEKGMTCCPFHGGNTPNMRISDRYYCFDCRASGDVIDFVAAYLDVDKLEAAKLIANDFGIPIEDQPLSKPSSPSTKDKSPPTPEQRHEWRVQKTQRQCEKWRTRSIDLLNSYYAILDEQERACIRRRSEASERNALDRITEKKAVIQFYLNTLQSGTLDDQIDLYLFGREVITRIERRLEKHQQGEAGQAIGGDGAGGLRPGTAASE